MTITEQKDKPLYKIGTWEFSIGPEDMYMYAEYCLLSTLSWTDYIPQKTVSEASPLVLPITGGHSSCI